MTAQDLIFFNQGKFDNFSTENKQPIQPDSLINYSFEGATNIEINYWILLTIPVLLIIAFLIELRKKYLPSKRSLSLESTKQTCSCYQCQYFNQNPYIKCAVNPFLALTEEASNCKDFKSN